VRMQEFTTVVASPLGWRISSLVVLLA
jgi:hypothetical protein